MINTSESPTEPFIKVVTDLIRECSNAPASRTTAVTALVLSIWQEASRGTSAKSPSFILVNATGADNDPVQAFTENLFGTREVSEDELKAANHNTVPDPEKASRLMLATVRSQLNLEASSPLNPPKSNWEPTYHNARLAAHGRGDVSHYARAWHPDLQLITDQKNAIILRVDDKADKEAFRKDVLNDPSKLADPCGPGAGLHICNKMITISGALAPGECDDALVESILNLGMPFFFLPHAVETPVNIPNAIALKPFLTFAKVDAQMPSGPIPRFQNDPWSRRYQDAIWMRLAHLPSNYRLPVLESIHNIASVCESIAIVTGKFEDVDTPSLTKLAAELYTNTLRGVAMSLAYLAWHGLGFGTASPLSMVRKLLRALRTNKTMTLRDVQRLGFKTAALRDDVLGGLEAEGLLALNGKQVVAVSHIQFVQNLHAREEFPIAVIGGADQ